MSGIGARTGLVALAGLCLWPGAGAAQNVIGGYRAHIGQADLVNSRGVALTQPWQVIRQDRANVHRFAIRQPGDERDPWFGSAEMRAALENWVRYGDLGDATGARIMAGGIDLYVEVLGVGGAANGVRVMLDRPDPDGGVMNSGGLGDGGEPGAGGLTIELE